MLERGVCVQTPVASVLTRPTSAVKPVNVTSKVRFSWPRAKCVQQGEDQLAKSQVCTAR
jgi:hypothetical protein